MDNKIIPAKRGRPPGTPNKVTKDMRDKFDEILQKKSTKISQWLDKVAEDDPGKAIDLLIKMTEFVMPKLNKIGIDGDIRVTDVKIIEIPLEGEEVEHGPTKLVVND